MKPFITLLLFFLLFQVSLPAQDYSLTVNDGTGSGTYNYGDTVHVFSDKSSATGVFNTWSGNAVDYLAISDEWYTTLLVPEGSGETDLFLQANFDLLPPDVMQITQMISLFGEEDGSLVENLMKEVHYSIPDNPKGLVFLFHGSGGSGSNMFSRYESFTLIKDLYYAGYGSIATDANERTLGDQNGDEIVRWIANQGAQQTIDNNIDLLNISSLRDTFVARYDLPGGFPFFSYGVSNGANFSDIAAAVVGFQASGHNTGNGSPSLYHQHQNVTPVIWLQSINDQNENANPDAALANYQALLDRGICSEWYWLERSPLYEERFVRSRNNISLQKSMEIYDLFIDYPDLVDAEGFFLADDIISVLPSGFYEPLDLTNAQIADVRSQIKVANADHVGHGNFNKTIIRFFENTCVLTEVENKPEPSIEVSFYPNPTTGLVYLNSSSNEAVTIKVLDITGRLLFEQKEVLPKTAINISHLRSGYYTICLSFGDGLLSKKLILQKG